VAATLCILLVDDNRFDRELASCALRTYVTPPPRLLEAESWDDAGPLLDAGGVDLLLLDFNLPRMSGLEILHELASRPNRPPVVMLTGQEDVETAVATLRAGAHDYVVKSVDWGPVLGRTIERVMEHVHLERQLAEARARLAAHAAELEQRVAARTAILRAQATKIEELYLKSEEAGRLKDEIASTVSHELRTPLNVILGYTELLSDRVSDAGAGELLGKVRVQAEHLRTLVESVLAFGRLSRGDEGVTCTSFELRDVVAELRSEANVLNTGRSLTIAFDVPPPTTVDHDRDKIRAIAYHLVSNALKFTSEGRVEVTIAARADGGVAVRVVDTGIGIPPEARALAFEDFRQLDGSETRRHEGLGLGLGIVKRYTALLGGTAMLEETPGGGTTITVELPPVRVRSASHSA
jgi:signal transduction histidine kinase